MIQIIKNDLDKKQKALIVTYKNKYRPDFLAKCGIQLINDIVTGGKINLTPPVLTGRLRGSGSVFVGSKFVGGSPIDTGKGTPNKNHNEKDNIVTVGFNTEYAARWHENEFTPGEVSAQAGNTGPKYIEKHLQADGKDLTKLYAMLLKKASE